MFTQQILVLFCEAINVVDDFTSIVMDHKLWSVELASLFVVGIGVLLEVELMEFSQEVFIIATNGAFFVNELEERWLGYVFGLKEV